MNNHWLDSAKRKKIFKELDIIGIEVCSEDGTFGDFLLSLNDDQKDFLMNMSLNDFMSNPNDCSFGFDLIP